MSWPWMGGGGGARGRRFGDGDPGARLTGLGPPGFGGASQLLAPVLELAQHLGTPAALPVGRPGPELVLLVDLVTRDQVLEIPGRVGRLPLLVHAAPAGRVREANPLV